jgi:hypothetical protein
MTRHSRIPSYLRIGYATQRPALAAAADRDDTGTPGLTGRSVRTGWPAVQSAEGLSG